MLISVFTPSHNARWLDDAMRSMLAQTHTDWEWVVLLNGGATWAPDPADPRIRVEKVTKRVKGIGEAKRLAAEATTGPVLVELDHDDLLLPRALEAVAESLTEHPEQRFVYSDFAEIEIDGAGRTEQFRADHGWVYTDVTIDGKVLRWCHTMEASPHNVSLIWYAPNHLRAFTRELYDEVGGYDAALTVLDDQDLMARMYLRTGFGHIEECLYLQRMHPGNTQSEAKTNAFIQQHTVVRAGVWLERLALAWAAREGLLAIDISPDGPRDGYIGAPGLSSVPGQASDVGGLRLDVPDNSVGVLRAVDALQLAPDKIGSLDEVYRVLAHGGHAWLWMPSTDGRGAFQDPRHRSYWNENSFWYVTDENQRRLSPATQARFQVSRLQTLFLSEWYRKNNLPYVVADLIAIKDGPREGGLLAV